MRGLSRRLALTALGVVVFGALVAFGAGAAGAKPGHRTASGGQGRDVRVRRHAPGPDGEVRQGRRHADVQEADEATASRATTGCVQAFPPNTGVGWYTMATGTYPSEHGSTNNTYFRTRRRVLEPDVVLRRRACCRPTRSPTPPSGRARRSPRSTGSAARPRTSTARRSTSRTSSRTAACSSAPPNAVEQAGSAFFGVTYQVATVAPATGWTNVPAGDPAAPPKETTWTINSTFAAQNPNRTYNVYFYDSVVGGGVKYDHAIVSPVGKTGAAPSIDLKVGDFLPIKLTGANGLIGARAGQTVGHYIKLISLAPDASQFKLYDTSLARAIAKCGTVVRRPARRRRRRGQAREVHRRQPPAVGRGRLRARGGRRRRRGHLRPAGP